MKYNKCKFYLQIYNEDLEDDNSDYVEENDAEEDEEEEASEDEESTEAPPQPAEGIFVIFSTCICICIIIIIIIGFHI